MRYLDVCSGISAPTMAWKPLGWEAAAYSEIEAFPRSVLAHRYPDTPIFGRDRQRGETMEDYAKVAGFQNMRGDEYGPIDLLVGGTPCQSFSVAGLRGGLGDDRGNLALEYLRLADRARPRWLVWENVPGALSSNGGRDFGAILGGMGELGYGFAYRVLDAQHFGVPQRRRRVFVVGHLGDWRRAAAVLFERHSLSGDTPPRRQARQGTAGFTASSFGGYREGIGTLRSEGGDLGGGSESLVAFSGQSLSCNADLAPTLDTGAEHHNRGIHCFTAKDHGGEAMQDCSPALRAGGHSGSHANAGVMPAVAFAIQERAVSENLANGPQGKGYQADCAFTLEARNQVQSVAVSAVRRLTPRECERLQGFPDDFTLVPHRGRPAADGPRYKALGNSMAVPVVAWIGQRLKAVDQIR